MLQQTRFLVAAFRAYDRLLDESGLADEHTLRDGLLVGATAPPLTHAVVTVADEVIDGRGLWPADFDLLTRLPGLARVDVIATEETLATGWHERLHTLLPGIVEERFATGDTRVPQLVAPPRDAGRLHWVSRDREEELADAVRRAKLLARTEGPGALDRFAIVFQRPLPYVYLARQIFGAAGVPYQASDALPLAAEPFVAAIDLVFSAVIAGFSRGAVVALLRSPHFRFHAGERTITPDAIAALDAVLQQVRFLGGRERLEEVGANLAAGRVPAVSPPTGRAAADVARAMVDAAHELAPLERDSSPSEQLATLASFIRRHEVLPEPGASWGERHRRARAAILGALEALGAAHARYDDHPRRFADLAGTIRRWIEMQTFSPRTGRSGVQLVDASAARYGDFDEIRLAGLIDTDWPAAIPRTVFYPAALLTPLGWPQERERRLGARSAFRDLLQLAPHRVSLSTVTLEDDALVRPSALLEDLAEAGLPVAHQTAAPRPRIFTHEALSEEPVAPGAVSGETALWLALRAQRPPASSSEFHGTTDPQPERVYRPSAVERYLQCPFKYFADRVLRLEEEREDEPGLTPQARGLILHEILQEFFATWRASGRGAITVENFAEAVAEFSRAADARLDALGDADRALERARLLGSAVATGLAERVFEFEIGSSVAVVDRLLEYTLEGAFTLQGEDGPRPIGVRGKADRIDLLSDGTLRVIDYKLGGAPKIKQAIQLPVYGACAEQQLAGHQGRTWTFGAAGYVAFGDPRSFVPVEPRGKSFADAVREGQERFVAAIQGIESGRFPVRPAEPYRCAYCAYPSVCRKDYVGDE
jgi:RecB family exonuclease